MGKLQHQTRCFSIVLLLLLLLVVRQSAWAAQAAGTAQAPQRFVFLNAAEPDSPAANADGGLLLREILRQAVLIAARDELGLSTRDETLREFNNQDDASRQILDIQTTALVRDKYVVTLQHGPAVARTVLWHKEIALPSDSIDYLKLIETAEQLARTELINVFRKAGYPNESTSPSATLTRLTKLHEKLLGRMTFPSQFAVVRQLHSLLRTEKDSSEALGGLVRGYANLGQLTAFHWNATHKAFKARALLYAERLVVLNPSSPTAHWHRAYARALAGFPEAALRSLADAEKLQTEVRPAVAAPAWVELIRSFCRFDVAQLSTIDAAEPDGQLAAFLNYLTLEAQSRNQVFLLFTMNAVNSMPECHRLYDGLYATNNLSARHLSAELGPTNLAITLGPRLLEMRDLPADIRRKVDGKPAGLQPAGFAEVATGLVEAGSPSTDAGEPSWTVLGRLMQEVSFVQVARNLDRVRRALGRPPSEVQEIIRESMPLIAGHPYRDFLLSYGVDERLQPDVYASLLKHLDVVDIEFTAAPLVTKTLTVNTPGKVHGKEGQRLALLHLDETADDLALALTHAAEKRRPAYARRLLDISPHAPQPVIALVQYDWKFAAPRALEWEKLYSGMPTVLAALGMKYSTLKQYDDAERCLKAYLRLSPDRAGYQQLASNYKAQNDLVRWKETLDNYLKTEDLGLDHARIRVDMAKHFMSRKEWDKAKPYAEAAAETAAAWAMMCAAECNEALKDWDAAEKYVRDTAEQYEYSRPEWLFWCVRTGKGDIEQARKLAAARFELLRGTKDRSLLMQSAEYFVLAQKPKDAHAVFKQIVEQPPADRYAEIHFALLCDELGQTEDRDATLQKVVERGRKPPEKRKLNPGDKPIDPVLFAKQATFVQAESNLAELFSHALSVGPSGKLDLEAVDKVIQEVAPEYFGDLQYFTGRFLELRGQLADADRFLRACAHSDQTRRATTILACYRLRARNVDP